MASVISEIANRVSATMRENGVGFDTAYRIVMRSYPYHSLEETKKAVGRELGRRKRRPRKKKVTPEQLNLLLDEEVLTSARQHELALTAGIPEDDL